MREALAFSSEGIAYNRSYPSHREGSSACLRRQLEQRTKERDEARTGIRWLRRLITNDSNSTEPLGDGGLEHIGVTMEGWDFQFLCTPDAYDEGTASEELQQVWPAVKAAMKEGK
jgi:hypothetical protein